MSVEIITNSINQTLGTKNNWLNVNKFKVNTHMSHHIVLSHRKSTSLPPIRLVGETVPQTGQTKFLGITLDTNLSFNLHINEIRSKLSRSVGILNKLKSLLPEEILKNLLYSLVHPYIDYNIYSRFGSFQKFTKKLIKSNFYS